MTLTERETDQSFCLCVRREIDGRTWTLYSGEHLGRDRVAVGEPLLSINNVAAIIQLLKFLETKLGVHVEKIPSPSRLCGYNIDANF